MKITSSTFKHKQPIPAKYACNGKDINPPLRIIEIPKQAQSLVLIVDDPDAPAGTWTHWTVWNINPSIDQIQENSVPEGAIQGVTSFGKPGYGGPCPPSGSHRYFFKIYALDTKLDLDSSANVENLKKAIKNHILDKAVLIGVYQK